MSARPTCLCQTCPLCRERAAWHRRKRIQRERQRLGIPTPPPSYRTDAELDRDAELWLEREVYGRKTA